MTNKKLQARVSFMDDFEGDDDYYVIDLLQQDGMWNTVSSYDIKTVENSCGGSGRFVPIAMIEQLAILAANGWNISWEVQ